VVCDHWRNSRPSGYDYVRSVLRSNLNPATTGAVTVLTTGLHGKFAAAYADARVGISLADEASLRGAPPATAGHPQGQAVGASPGAGQSR
jgi:hypothetical protein